MNANGIAVTVEEPAPGQFFWVLEQQQRVRAAIERAVRPMPSYGLAVMAGISALERRTAAANSLCARGRVDVSARDFGPTTIAGCL
ncbi:MAG: hypothetical protein EOP80_10425 [Variovorax sp.]|nr:MAG: hypothetical protein EOP80_10425 [Variovorax sp.]